MYTTDTTEPLQANPRGTAMVVLLTLPITCSVAVCNWPKSLGKELKANHPLYHHPLLVFVKRSLFFRKGKLKISDKTYKPPVPDKPTRERSFSSSKSRRKEEKWWTTCQKRFKHEGGKDKHEINRKTN